MRLSALTLALAVFSTAFPDATRAARCLAGDEAAADRADIRALRGEIEASCDCAAGDRRAYRTCVRSAVLQAAGEGALRRVCRLRVVRLERQSVCVSSHVDPVVCLEDHGDGRGTVRCRIRPAAACVSGGGAVRQACSAPDWPYTHCVDAGDTNGDLRVAAPLDEGRCTIGGEIFDLPSAAQPAETPGTPGVVVSDGRLLAQLGPNPDLNVARYTRWRFNGPERQPDAVLILVAGFGGGANNVRPLAQNLISRVYRDHGLVLEVWGFHRRSNALEDRAGALIALETADAQIALDWYYGAELGLALHPALAVGPNRRAFFYNGSDDVPFIANWTTQVFSRDIDAVVDAARAVARNANVFLGGHSAGSGFTARYAATDFDFSGAGPPEPGYAKLRGLVLLEGGAGRTDTEPLSEDSLDRIVARFEGGLFGAVRDGEARCVDGTTPCAVDTEAADCAGLTPPVCTPSVGAYASFLPGVGPGLLASSEVAALQGFSDPDGSQMILQVDQGAPGNNAIAVVPDLGLLAIFGPGTVSALVGGFLDDESLAAAVSPAVATSLGAPGPEVGQLATWLDIGAILPASVLPDNGPPPTALPARLWGQEKEVVRIDRVIAAFHANGANSADWYYPTAGLATTSVPGRCVADVCTAGDVGSACQDDGDCGQSISLDSSALSLDPPAGRGRRDIVNLTQAGAIDIPVISVGASNGLTPVPASYLPFAQSIGLCAAPSCDGTPRVVDPGSPNPAFPTFGGVAGGYEVHIAEGLSHADMGFAEDDADTADLYVPLAAFLARNSL